MDVFPKRHPEKQKNKPIPQPKRPDWLRVKAPAGRLFNETQNLMRDLNLVTVCEEAACPIIGECWSKKHATMMILGSSCTRACAFCNIATGRPDLLDPHEPENVAQAVAKLNLKHVVITSVDRDDLEDGGAVHFAHTITAIRALSPATTIEILTPDFLRKPGAVEIVIKARPDVFNHNMETVPRLYRTIRPGARFEHSLSILAQVKKHDPMIFTKSILLGKPINIFNKGDMARDFTYIDDIVDGVIAALDKNLSDCANIAPHKIFNLGNNKPIKLMDYIRIIEKACSKKANLKLLPMQPGDVLETFADIKHSTEELGFSPKTNLDEGIPRFVEWFREYHK